MSGDSEEAFIGLIFWLWSYSGKHFKGDKSMISKDELIYEAVLLPVEMASACGQTSSKPESH